MKHVSYKELDGELDAVKALLYDMGADPQKLYDLGFHNNYNAISKIFNDCGGIERHMMYFTADQMWAALNMFQFILERSK